MTCCVLNTTVWFPCSDQLKVAKRYRAEWLLMFTSSSREAPFETRSAENVPRVFKIFDASKSSHCPFAGLETNISSKARSIHYLPKYLQNSYKESQYVTEAGQWGFEPLQKMWRSESYNPCSSRLLLPVREPKRSCGVVS